MRRTFQVYGADHNEYRGEIRVAWRRKQWRTVQQAIRRALTRLPSFPDDTRIEALDVYRICSGVYYVDDKENRAPLYQLYG